MTAAEMQAIAPAPVGYEWDATGTGVSWHAWLHEPRGPFVLHICKHGGHVTAHPFDLSVVGAHDHPLDALLALRRLAGHLWPWPGWPGVPGVRPAGWGPRPTADEREAHSGKWLYRYNSGGIWLTCDTDGPRKPGDEPEWCAIDTDGRWVEVDTRATLAEHLRDEGLADKITEQAIARVERGG